MSFRPSSASLPLSHQQLNSWANRSFIEKLHVSNWQSFAEDKNIWVSRRDVWGAEKDTQVQGIY